MATENNRCPECGTSLSPELVRCSSCLAFVHDINPWQREHKLIAFPVAVVLTTILAVVINLEVIPGVSTILGNGISLTIVGIGIYALIVIFLKNLVTTRQVKAFRIIRRLLAPGHKLTPNTLGKAREDIALSNLTPYNTLLAYNRLQWVVDAAAIDTRERELLLRSMHEHNETDWESLEGTFTFVQYLVWLLPSLGFLGTVWGMTNALNKFSGVVNQSVGDLSFQNSLSETAQNLGVAFHTTLVGLALVIPVLLAATAARRRVQHLLEQLDRFFIRYCSQPFAVTDPAEHVPDVEGSAAELTAHGSFESTEDNQPPWPMDPCPPADESPAEAALTTDDGHVKASEIEEDFSENRAIVEAAEMPPIAEQTEIGENKTQPLLPNQPGNKRMISHPGGAEDETQPETDTEPE